MGEIAKVRREAHIMVNQAQRERSDRVPGANTKHVCADRYTL
jgi:hypothetical protein